MERFPLNGLDRNFVTHHYPGMSINSHHIMDTTRAFDRPRLHASMESMARDVQLARSFVEGGPLRAERFVRAEPWFKLDELLAWSDATLDATSEGELLDWPFDLAIDPPWRVSHYPRLEGGFRLALTLHHSMADGG